MDRHSLLAEIHIYPKILDNALFAQHNSPHIVFPNGSNTTDGDPASLWRLVCWRSLCECEGTLDYPSFSLAEGVKIK